YRHTLRRAYAVGLGGALADFAYSTLGIVGIGPYVQAYPVVPHVLYAVSGAVLIGYGAITVRTRPVKTIASDAAAAPARGDVWSGLSTGLALILLNPATLVTWIVIVGSSKYLAAAGTAGGLAASTGIFIGSFTWFALVAYLTNHGKRVMGDKAVWIPRTVGML